MIGKPRLLSRLSARSGSLAFAVFATLLPTWLLSSVFGVAVSEVWAQHLDSDRLLFRDGSALLLETVRSSMPFLRGVGTLTAPTLAALTFVSLFVWSALLDVLARPASDRLRPADFAAASTRHVGVFAVLFAVFLILRGLLLGVTVFLVQGIAPAIARDATERGQTIAALVAALVGWTLLEGLRLLQDLITVACVRHETSLAAAALSALGVFRDRFGALVLRKALYLFGVALVVGVAVLAPSSLWEQRGAIFLRALVHQGALALLVVGRAAWLTFLLEEIGPKPARWPLETEDPAGLEGAGGAGVASGETAADETGSALTSRSPGSCRAVRFAARGAPNQGPHASRGARAPGNGPSRRLRGPARCRRAGRPS
jgi:hypothetical protein